MPKPIRRIGASKLSTVSECQTPQGTHVALKEYDRQSLTNFQHERIFAAAERWKTLTIPGLVPYLEVLPAQNQIIMELFDRSAAIRLSEGHSDPRLVLHALRGILAALAQLHEQGWLHVNLKPSNVFFDGDGRARLSDGLLISASAPATLPPPTNQKYLTPEHTSDAFGPMTPATDLYTVGFMALELLAGDRFGRAFQGIGDDAADDDLAWFQWHGSSQEAPSAQAFAKTCPTELAAVIARLVAKQPAVRYATARQALQELPQDISGQSRQPAAAAAATPSAPREALATHVVERPATGIVLAVASGARAGEMIGTNESELMIGFDHDCFLRFSGDQYTHSGGKVLMRRGPEGWYVLRVAGDSAFVNQHFLEEKFPLRSGDIVRLSSRGPDVQFTMQSGGVAIRSLVERFLPQQSPRPTGPSSPSRGPKSPASAAPSLGSQGRPGSGQAASPAAANAPLAPAPRQPTAASPQPPARPAQAPTSAAGPAKPQAFKAPVAKPKAVKAAKAQTPSGSNAAASFSWLAPQTWSKNQKNLVIAIVGGLLVIIAVVLFPTSAPPAPPEDSPATESPATESPAIESPATESAATESAATESPAEEAPAVETPPSSEISASPTPTTGTPPDKP